MDPTKRLDDDRGPGDLNRGYSFDDFRAARDRGLERLRVQSEVYRLECLYALPSASEGEESD